jgi:hypothetical protein
MKNKTIFGALATVSADVSPFNLWWLPLLYLPDNDMIDEELNDTLLHINISVKPENPKSRLCVLVAFTRLHLCTFMSVNKYLLKHDRDIWFRSKILSFKLVFINKFELQLVSLLSGTMCMRLSLDITDLHLLYITAQIVRLKMFVFNSFNLFSYVSTFMLIYDLHISFSCHYILWVLLIDINVLSRDRGIIKKQL